MTDLIVPRQFCTEVSVRFDEASLAELFEDLVDRGCTPRQFARIWLHTHPGECPQPSFTDESTFAEKFSDPDWAVMGILARQGATYARLRWNLTPSVDVELPVSVTYSVPFGPSRFEEWEALYREQVVLEEPRWFRPVPEWEADLSWWGWEEEL